jgi:ferric-dicitrate binding protein FerR (iron transport regulator)
LKESDNHINEDTLVKFLLGETDENETREVQHWLDSSVEHRKHFEQYKLIWEESRKLKPMLKTDEEMAWQRFQVRIKHNTGAPLTKQPKLPYLRIAAMVVIALGAALAVWLLNQNRQVEYITQVSREYVITDSLPDGSLVTLNRNSSIVYPERFSGASRKITMKGEAFFDVTPDKDHPFIIEVNDVTIKVLGTSFNVRTVDGKTEVIVETGVVEVAGSSASVRLHPREKVVMDKQDPVIEKEKVSDKLYNYYATRSFVCDGTPLWKLVEILNQAYQADIVIRRKELRELQLTTTFDNESLDNILNIISQTFTIKVTREEGKIILE